jgi:Mrp family chromosome partitioning ATPase
MGNTVAKGTAAQRKTLPDSGQGPAAEGISLFGIRPARILNIPLRRWKLSLLILVLCAPGAVGYAMWRSELSYEAVGRLQHRPPAEKFPEIPEPPAFDTILALFKSNNEYYLQLNERFGLAIYPDIWQRIFSIAKIGGDDSKVIEVRLKWQDREQGTQLVNSLMELHRKAMTADRERDLTRVLNNTEHTLQESERRKKAAVADRDAFLAARKAPANPKLKLDEINTEIKRLENQLDLVDADREQAAREVQKRTEEIKEREAKRKAGIVDPKDITDDPEYKRQRGQLQETIRQIEKTLADTKGELEDRERDYARKKPLADKGLIIVTEIEKLDREVKKLRGAVKTTQASLEFHQALLSDLKPGNAQIIRLTAERRELENKRDRLQSDVERLTRQRNTKREQYDQMALLEKEVRGRDEKVAELDNARVTLVEQKSNVSRFLRNAASELEVVGAGASSSPSPISDFKKQLLIGFLIFALPCFALLTAHGMRSALWRAEVLSDRLRLPILAQASSETRALSLRIRQLVPNNGGAVLISSLNEGNGVDQLVSGLARYAAMRDEHVLILDGRIARTQAAALQALIERRADGQPPEVVPSTDGDGDGDVEPGMAGLAQYLVFEDQSYTKFTYHTHHPGVDYMPAGGPYPVTDALASEPMNELVQTLRKEYTLLLVLGPAMARSVDTEILAAYVDGMVFVLNNPLSVFSSDVEDFVRSLREKNAPLLGSVLCV